MRQIREMIALAMLAVSAYTDIKEKNIYIMPLLISSAGAVVISLIHMFEQPGRDVLADDLILPVITGMILITVIYAYREHIGMGDAYLLAALGMVTGVRNSLYTTAVSVLFASVYAVISLALCRSRRRNSRYRIAFAPFVMAGFVLVLMRM